LQAARADNRKAKGVRSLTTKEVPPVETPASSCQDTDLKS
jgi:hypothetical protein